MMHTPAIDPRHTVSPLRQHERRPPADLDAQSGDCSVCTESRGVEEEFLQAPSTRLAGVALRSEAVVESVGFCRHHGAALVRRRDHGLAIARILGGATHRMITWLNEESRYAERLIELFFAAYRSCPLCKLHDHHAVRHIHRLSALGACQASSRWLCFPHYRDAAYALKSPALAPLVEAQVRLLEGVVAAIGPFGADPDSSSIAPKTLAWAVRVVGGDFGLTSPVSPSGSGDPELASDVAVSGNETDDMGCPVCAEICDAEKQWLSMVQCAAKLGQDLWTVFPTCATHIASCARVGDPKAALVATRYAAAVELHALRQGTDALARDTNEREVAARSVFYRRKSAGYVLGQQRRMITDVRPCAACERLVIAQERAIGKLLKRSGNSPYACGEHLSRLCLKHFSAVYLLARPGQARGTLAALQSGKLLRLLALLEHASDSSDPSAIEPAVRQGMLSWQAAMPRMGERRRGGSVLISG